jgi:hypothetical protein
VKDGVNLVVGARNRLESTSLSLERRTLPNPLDRRRCLVSCLLVDDLVLVRAARSTDNAVSSRRDRNKLVADNDRSDVHDLRAVSRGGGELHLDERDAIVVSDSLEVSEVPLRSEEVGAETLDGVNEDTASLVEVGDVVARAEDTADLATRPEAVNAVTVGTGDNVGSVALRLLAGVLAVVGEATLGSGTELETSSELLEDEGDLDVVVVLALDGDSAKSDEFSFFCGVHIDGREEGRNALVGRSRVDGDGELVGLARTLVELLGRSGLEARNGNALEGVLALAISVTESELNVLGEERTGGGK